MFKYSYSSITLKDAIKEEPTLLGGFVLDTPEQTQEFITVFRGMWDTYDIGGETISLFKEFITNRFNMNKPYYQELINVYLDELNYKDGKKAVIAYTGSMNSDDTDYDLPRKDGSSGKATSQIKKEGQIASTKTLTGDVDVVDLKSRYLKYLRNVYKEFAETFKDCFSLIYG